MKRNTLIDDLRGFGIISVSQAKIPYSFVSRIYHSSHFLWWPTAFVTVTTGHTTSNLFANVLLFGILPLKI